MLPYSTSWILILEPPLANTGDTDEKSSNLQKALDCRRLANGLKNKPFFQDCRKETFHLGVLSCSSGRQRCRKGKNYENTR